MKKVELLRNWKEIINTGNLDKTKRMDFISKWLIITRASFFSMTPNAVLIGALLALNDGKINIVNVLLVLVAMILAHAGSNIVNDYFDHEYGLDSGDYTRMKYSPHPIGDRLVSKTQLIGAFILFAIIEVTIAIYFYLTVGVFALVIAVIGFLLGFFYTAPPLKLKYVGGIGEPVVFIVWGPLMTAGTYYVCAGAIPMYVWLASIPFGLLVMNVLLCDHLNKYEGDKKAGVRTLPVVIGTDNTLKLLKISTALFFVVIVILVAFNVLTLFSLVVFLAMGKFIDLMRIFSRKKPKRNKKNAEIWHVWYIVHAFNFNKPAGALFMAGLLLGAVPWQEILKMFGR